MIPVQKNKAFRLGITTGAAANRIGNHPDRIIPITQSSDHPNQ
jgi:hypothetical protein